MTTDSTFGDRMAEPLVLVEGLAAFVREMVFPAVDKSGDVIAIEADPSQSFGARVAPSGPGFRITVNAGLAKTLIAALDPLPEGPLLSVQRLSLSLFGEPPQEDVIRGSLVSAALIFILLHEYGHIAAGHFGLLVQAAGEPDALAFDEVIHTFAFDGADSTTPVGKLTELEADLIAFNPLMDLSYPIFMSDVDVRALMTGREPRNWQDRLIAPVVELMYYGAALALALLDAHRVQTKGRSDHPRPLTRVLNLAGLMVRRMIEGNWLGKSLEHELKVDAQVLEQLKRFFLPALVNSVELCEAALANVGFGAARGGRMSRQRWVSLTRDYINLLKGGAKRFVTVEGRELHELAGQLPGFSDFMTPHRVRPWWL